MPSWFGDNPKKKEESTKDFTDPVTEKESEKTTPTVHPIDTALARIESSMTTATREKFTEMEERLVTMAALIVDERKYFKTQIKYFINVAIQSFYQQEQRHIESRIIKLLKVHMSALDDGSTAKEAMGKHLEHMKLSVLNSDIPYACDTDQAVEEMDAIERRKAREAQVRALVKAACGKCRTYTGEVKDEYYRCKIEGSCPALLKEKHRKEDEEDVEEEKREAGV